MLKVGIQTVRLAEKTTVVGGEGLVHRELRWGLAMHFMFLYPLKYNGFNWTYQIVRVGLQILSVHLQRSGVRRQRSRVRVEPVGLLIQSPVQPVGHRRHLKCS